MRKHRAEFRHRSDGRTRPGMYGRLAMAFVALVVLVAPVIAGILLLAVGFAIASQWAGGR